MHRPTNGLYPYYPFWICFFSLPQDIAFTLRDFHNGSASDWCAQCDALYKFSNTIQYQGSTDEIWVVNKD